MRILAVDDSENARDILRATLVSGGFDDVVFAGSGVEALAALRDKNGYDVILLDVVMPDMDGIEACAQIRAAPHYADVPILMVTSQADMDTLAQAFVAGATDYVTKPFQRTELLARIRNAFRLKGELDRRRARESELLALADKLNRGFGDIRTMIDPATGVLARDVAESALRALVPGAAAPALLALQVDGLTAYRGSYGPGGVASLLQRLGDALKPLPGSLGDVLSYFGDGLFIALLQADAEAARVVAETALRQVAALGIPNAESRHGAVVTLSAGIAVLRRGDGREPRMLLADAIAAVEQAVAAGGNRIVQSEASLVV